MVLVLVFKNKKKSKEKGLRFKVQGSMFKVAPTWREGNR
jgi:hypothetical protein